MLITYEVFIFYLLNESFFNVGVILYKIINGCLVPTHLVYDCKLHTNGCWYVNFLAIHIADGVLITDQHFPEKVDSS